MAVTTTSRTERPRVAPPATGGPRTLSIDIGGSGLKALVLGPDGAQVTERVRVATPRPATPVAVAQALRSLIDLLGDFDRVSVGFPGAVVDGVVKNAPNLHDDWRGIDLARAATEGLKRPARVVNDAAMQGYGLIEGKGLEIVLTLGTGLGTSVFVEGHYVPNLELGHRPFRKGKTFEQYVGKKALKKIGKKKWNKRVRKVVEHALTLNPRKIYIGGGNAKHLRIDLPANVHIGANIAGLLGGQALWEDTWERTFAPPPS
jgi:polyphosphate glucokinase